MRTDEALRDAVSDVLARGVTYSEGFGAVSIPDARAFVGEMTDKILVVLRPHLGEGVNVEQREALAAILEDYESCYRTGVMGDENEGYVATLRSLLDANAIAAGATERGGAGHGTAESGDGGVQ